MSSEQRESVFVEVRQVQARDLGKLDRTTQGMFTVRIDGLWRDVFEVWDDDNDDPATLWGGNGVDDNEYVEAHPVAREIRKWVTGWASPCWVMVRYLVEEKSTSGELEDALHRWRTCDLVDVQVPVATAQVQS